MSKDLATLENLNQFIGSYNYHKWSVLFPIALTDGAKALAEGGEAYWLMDVIASHVLQTNEPFLVAKLEKHEDNSATFTLNDGNDNIISKQEIEYTDFPLSEIKLYVTEGGYVKDMKFVIMLPSEY